MNYVISEEISDILHLHSLFQTMLQKCDGMERVDKKLLQHKLRELKKSVFEIKKQLDQKKDDLTATTKENTKDESPVKRRATKQDGIEMYVLRGSSSVRDIVDSKNVKTDEKTFYQKSVEELRGEKEKMKALLKELEDNIDQNVTQKISYRPSMYQAKGNKVNTVARVKQPTSTGQTVSVSEQATATTVNITLPSDMRETVGGVSRPIQTRSTSKHVLYELLKDDCSRVLFIILIMLAMISFLFVIFWLVHLHSEEDSMKDIRKRYKSLEEYVNNIR